LVVKLTRTKLRIDELRMSHGCGLISLYPLNRNHYDLKIDRRTFVWPRNQKSQRKRSVRRRC
jgi:hypothetical protein